MQLTSSFNYSFLSHLLCDVVVLPQYLHREHRNFRRTSTVAMSLPAPRHRRYHLPWLHSRHCRVSRLPYLTALLPVVPGKWLEVLRNKIAKQKIIGGKEFYIDVKAFLSRDTFLRWCCCVNAFVSTSGSVQHSCRIFARDHHE